MKNSFCLFILFFTTLVCSAQNNKPGFIKLEDAPNNDFSIHKFSLLFSEPTTVVEDKNTRLKRMRNSGIVLMCSGAVVFYGGLGLIGSAFQIDNTSEAKAERGRKVFKIGEAVAVIGGVATAGGFIMMVVCQKKLNAQKRAGFSFGPGSASFTYKF